MADTIDLDPRPLEALTRTLKDGPKRLRLISTDVMRRGGKRAEARARQLASGDTLKVRTGSYRRAIGSATEVSGDTITTRVGILRDERTLRYAAIQEYGGTITPKNAKVLTIPAKASLTPAGVPRWTAREAASRFAATFWQRIKSGLLILFGRKATGSLVPLFFGKDRVTIKPKRTLHRSVEETLPSIRDELRARVIALIFTEAGPTGAIASD